MPAGDGAFPILHLDFVGSGVLLPSGNLLLKSLWSQTLLDPRLGFAKVCSKPQYKGVWEDPGSPNAARYGFTLLLLGLCSWQGSQPWMGGAQGYSGCN